MFSGIPMGYNQDQSQKRKLRCSPIRVEPHDIITIIVYRPRLSVFSLAVGLLMLPRIQQKEKGKFQLIYRYHDVFISIYRILNSAPPEKEHRISQNKDYRPA